MKSILLISLLIIIFAIFGSITYYKFSHKDDKLLANNLNTTSCKTNNLIRDKIQSVGYEIGFFYPKCVREYDLSSNTKFLKGVIDEDIEIAMMIKRSSINDEMKYLENTYYFIKNKSEHADIEFIPATKLKVKGKEFTYSKLSSNYVSKIDTIDPVYSETYSIAYKLDEDFLWTIEINVKDKKMSLDVVKTMLEIKVSEYDSPQELTKLNSNVLVGNMKQNFKGSYNTGYNVEIAIPNNYVEVSSENNNNVYNEGLFRDKASEYTIFFELENSKKIEDSLKTTISIYNDIKNREDITSHKIEQDKEIVVGNNTAKLVKVFYSQKDDKGINVNYQEITAIIKIDEEFIYRMWISTMNNTITDDMIKDFLNISYEKY